MANPAKPDLPPAKFKQFPKVKDWNGEGFRPIDFKKLKKLYLSGPDYEWTPFCYRNAFNPLINRDKWTEYGFDFSEWKKEWIKQKGIEHCEQFAPEALDLKKLVAIKRVTFVKDWINKSAYFKALLDATMRKHGEDLQHDVQNEKWIKNKTVIPRFKLDVDELGKMANAALRIQELESRSLLMLPGNKLVEPGSLQNSDENSVTDDEAKEVVLTTMGKLGMSAKESTMMLANWFDQAEKVATEKQNTIEAEVVKEN